MLSSLPSPSPSHTERNGGGGGEAGSLASAQTEGGVGGGVTSPQYLQKMCMYQLRLPFLVFLLFVHDQNTTRVYLYMYSEAKHSLGWKPAGEKGRSIE